jgi:hypothetical protein
MASGVPKTEADKSGGDVPAVEVLVHGRVGDVDVARVVPCGGERSAAGRRVCAVTSDELSVLNSTQEQKAYSEYQMDHSRGTCQVLPSS